jgi:putative FmdB family regulatory protein
MPTYQYSCACGVKKDFFHGINEKPALACASCGEALSRDFTPTETLGHVRGSTPAKAWKESRVRKKRNADLGVKQIERYGAGSKLVPNVGGQEVGSWKDAALLAKDQGKDTSKFLEMAEKEKSCNNSRGLDEKKWKELKEIKKAVG